MKEIWDRIEADYVEESQIQIPNPELGPLERRVGLTYEDALFSDDISIKDTEYWFTEPEGMLAYRTSRAVVRCCGTMQTQGTTDGQAARAQNSPPNPCSL